MNNARSASPNDDGGGSTSLDGLGGEAASSFDESEVSLPSSSSTYLATSMPICLPNSVVVDDDFDDDNWLQRRCCIAVSEGIASCTDAEKPSTQTVADKRSRLIMEQVDRLVEEGSDNGMVWEEVRRF